MGKKAVVLLSGGLDSATAAALAAKEGYELYALTVSYGQRHSREISSARALAEWLNVREHRIIELPLGGVLKSALTERAERLPVGDGPIGRSIPPTYVPARNTVLLSLALSWAESIGAEAIVLGANSIDYSGYPDCRPEFIEAFQKVISVGTKCGIEGSPIRLLVPLITMTKEEIIRTGNGLGVPFEHTWSCYAGGERPCGVCESCALRRRGFEKAGIEDPCRS